jgi:hypothetical protein
MRELSDTIRPPSLEQNEPVNRGESARLRSADVIGQATFSGCLAVVHVPRLSLQQVIPRVVRLPELDTPGVPCLLLFGEQSGATTCFGGVPMPWGIRYHELMIAVPFVRWETTTGEHLYVHKMVCDFLPGVWVGNNYYGFSKSFARMTWDGSCFSVNDESHELAFFARIGSVRQTPRSALAWIQSAAALTVLGRRQDGRFISSRFEWDFRGAVVDRASADLAVGQELLRLDDEDRSAWRQDVYRVRGMKWRLSWPEDTPLEVSLR